jgi:hypothetical protein
VNPNAVANGGFEAGLTGWTTGGAGAPVSSTAEAHGGTRSALITAPAGGNSTLAQTIGIPAAGTTTVSSWYRNNCNTTNCSITMQARSTDGVVLATLGTVTNATNAWTEIMADLTPYKGTSIQLVIENKSLAAGSGGSITYIDDISVTAK